MNISSNQKLKLCAFAAISVSVIIVIAKIYAYFVSNSLSMLASMVDSALDCLASTMNFVALIYALEPPDNDHRYGHGKIQDLAVFGQSIFFLISGLYLIYSSIIKLIHGTHVVDASIGSYVMIFSTILTLMLVTLQTYVLKNNESGIIEADRLHYLTDTLMNVAVIISLNISYYFPKIDFLDSVFAIGIAYFILKNSYTLFIKAYKNLIDEELDKESKEKIINILKSTKEVLGAHELKTRVAGHKIFIQFHIELNPDISLMEAHEICDKVHDKLKSEFQDSDIIIHPDPSGFNEPDTQFQVMF